MGSGALEAGPWPRATLGTGFHRPCKQTRPAVPTAAHLHEEWGRESEGNREGDVI